MYLFGESTPNAREQRIQEGRGRPESCISYTAAEKPLSPTPQITIVRDRFVPAGGYGAATVTLGEALARCYRTDAHFQAAVSPLGCRLASRHVGTTEITMGVLAFDLDGPGHSLTDDWRLDLATKVDALLAAHPGAYFYETRGGARLVWRLAEAFEIRSHDDAREWRARYLAACDHLTGRFGIEPDRACSDWQRLFRLPHATRDGVRPENLPTLGDPEAIGKFALPPLPDGTATHSRTGTERLPNANVSPCDAPGLLHDLLAARGAILGPAGPGAWLIRCPRHDAHTTGGPDDGATKLYAPNAGGYLGEIHCFHNACAGLTARDWLAILEGDAILTTHVATIDHVYADQGSSGFRLRVVLRGPGAKVVPFVRVHARHRARWVALFEAAGLAVPEPDNARAVHASVTKLVGKRLALEVDAAGVVRRILPGPGR